VNGYPVTNRPRIAIGHRTAVGRRYRGDWRQVRPAERLFQKPENHRENAGLSPLLEQSLKEETAASLVGAGMASVLLFPIAALALRRMAVLRQHARSEVAMPDKFA
jgi:hypothetical protein